MASVGGLRPLLGPMLAVLGRSWDLCWRSWVVLGAYVGGLGSGSGPKMAVVGRLQSLSWLSWAALGACVGGLELLSGPSWAVVAATLASVGSLGRGSGRKVAFSQAGAYVA